ncbi:MAG: hypothetical protein EHM70_04335 [Chloroflexota bacterium]|nr:MAG: hypothetical protein EHM70_04335 [Chloroflexota bacterium]
MPVSLLTTKLHLPLGREGQVARPRLIDKLDQAWLPGIRLILVSAPAGYGKTTLLAEWMAHLRETGFHPGEKGGPTPSPKQLQSAWLTLDEGDNSPLRFLSYLVAALKAGLTEDGYQVLQAALDVGIAGQPLSIPDLLTSLVNDLNQCAQPVILTLDEYFSITNPAVHEIVKLILLNLPPAMRLAIITRADPPLGLAQLRARGQLCEIRTADLQFSNQEAGEFLNGAMGLNLLPQDITALERRTEGWIAGLQMAAIALRAIAGQTLPYDQALLSMQMTSEYQAFIQTFRGSHRFVLEYLLEEVFNHQPVDIQSFLLRTAVLERLCASLCEALLTDQQTSNTPAQETLEWLEHNNLFLVPLDDEHHWYRYHRLFGDLLNHRLRQALGPAEVLCLHRKAVAWYEQQGMLAEAIGQALSGRDPETAADLLERHGLTFFYRSEIVQVHHWLQVLPEDLILSRPLLCGIYAAVIALLPPYPPQSLDTAEKWMRAAERGLSESDGRDLLGRVFTMKIRSYWSQFRREAPEKIISAARQALALLPAETDTGVDKSFLRVRSALLTNLGIACSFSGDEAHARETFLQAHRISRVCGDLLNEVAVTKYLVMIRWAHGELVEAAAFCREALERFDLLQTSLGRAIPYSRMIAVQLAEILIEWNQLAEAKIILSKNLELAKWAAGNDVMGYDTLECLLRNMARLEQARGDTRAALGYLDEAERVSGNETQVIAAQRARLWLAQRLGKPIYLDYARRWAAGRSLVDFKTGPHLRDRIEPVTLARVMLAEQEALAAGKRNLSTPKFDSLLRWLERQKTTMQALGWAHWLIEVQLVECLARRSMGDLAEAREAMNGALELASRGGYMRVFLDEGEWLRLFLAEMKNGGREVSPYIEKVLEAFPKSPEAPAMAQPLIEPLTARELEVLRMICQGLSNQEISSALFITLNTVKKHGHSIFGKLEVANRAQAIVRARHLQLVE